MKILLAFSGGKDSHAALIWAVKKYGADKVIAVFCDTEWENYITYQVIRKVIDVLGVDYIIARSKKI